MGLGFHCEHQEQTLISSQRKPNPLFFHTPTQSLHRKNDDNNGSGGDFSWGNETKYLLLHPYGAQIHCIMHCIGALKAYPSSSTLLRKGWMSVFVIPPPPCDFPESPRFYARLCSRCTKKHYLCPHTVTQRHEAMFRCVTPSSSHRNPYGVKARHPAAGWEI